MKLGKFTKFDMIYCTMDLSFCFFENILDIVCHWLKDPLMQGCLGLIK